MSMVDEFPDLLDKTHLIKDIIKERQRAVDNIARCTRIREELDARLAALLEHQDEGQRTYYEAGYEIVVKAALNYSLDKEEYEVLKNQIPSEFDFVRKSKKEVITYNLDKKVIRECKKYASQELLDMLFGEGGIVTEKPRSLSIYVGSPS